ncbi:MAG: sulfotransferase [Caulobacterales bacterium]|nr:sulfotransferase [Caulobacterales bacterium]
MTASSAAAFHQGLAAAHAGDFERAFAIARSMIARDPNDVHAYQIVGVANFLQGRIHEALDAFIRANQLAPRQPPILHWIGVLMRERGDFAQSRTAFSRAAELAPENPEHLANLAETLVLMSARDEAQEAFEKAVRIEPPSAVVLAKAARFFEQSHDLARASALAERAFGLAPKDEIVLIAKAEIDQRRGRPEEVIALLKGEASASAQNQRNHAKLFRILADAYDKTDRYDEAFAAYSASNNLQRALYADYVSHEKSPLTAENLDRMIAYYQGVDASSWTRYENLEERAPAFIVGFTRSGTTWLDQIIASHPGAMVMEEEDNFIDVWNELHISDEGLARLAGLTRDEVNGYRRAYWRRARANMKEPENGGLVVDKVPLNTVQLGLIYRLFPEAKVIFAQRDPRDSIFSNFQQHYAMNAAMYQFLALDTAAAFYDRVMTLGRLCREKFPLAVHDVRYESLVEDLEGEARRFIPFLGLDWTPDVLDYRETAMKRTILTPSLRQVVQKPYATSIGKWRNYEKEMRSVLPILDKWAALLGYEVNER